MLRKDLERYLDEYLKVSQFKDYAPNGLQVEGRTEVRKVVTGVTACQALIDRAIALQADTILVHHGYFWKSEPTQIVGMKQKRIKSLLMNDINLMGYHLPLDAHDELGNNAMFGKLLGIKSLEQRDLVHVGELESPVEIGEFVANVSNVLNRPALHLPGGPDLVQKIAWCSGGAQRMMSMALDADVYVSGEVSEDTTHIALEEQIHYLSAGHHATEVLGIRALGEHLAQVFGLDVTFVDVPNPV